VNTMRHLSTVELVDLAEGASDERVAPHLAECGRCRRELADLRAMMSAVADVDVPEPSPLFWDHFSDRVRAAVAEEGAAGREARPWWRAWLWWRGSVVPSAAVAIVALVVTAVVRLTMPSPAAPARPLSQPSATNLTPSAAIELDDSLDDPTLSFMTDLTTTWDLDVVREQMTQTRPIGSADEAFGALSDDERQELQRLLTEQLARPSAS
jgi:hypothetical protein